MKRLLLIITALAMLSCLTVGAAATAPDTEEPLLSEETVVSDTAAATEDAAVYYVFGSAALCGSDFDPVDPNNRMQEVAVGIWTHTFSNVQPGTYRLCVTDGQQVWSDAQVGTDQGEYILEITEAADVTVTFDAQQQTVKVDFDINGVAEPDAAPAMDPLSPTGSFFRNILWIVLIAVGIYGVVFLVQRNRSYRGAAVDGGEVRVSPSLSVKETEELVANKTTVTPSEELDQRIFESIKKINKE